MGIGYLPCACLLASVTPIFLRHTLAWPPQQDLGRRSPHRAYCGVDACKDVLCAIPVASTRSRGVYRCSILCLTHTALLCSVSLFTTVVLPSAGGCIPSTACHPGGCSALEPGARSDQANDQSLPWWEGVEKEISLALETQRANEQRL